MLWPRDLRIVFKAICSVVAFTFFWSQLCWAGTGDLLQEASASNKSGFMTVTTLQAGQSVAQSVINMKNAIAHAASTIRITSTSYAGGRVESTTLSAPDASGNIYYHYLNEDWNGQGYGRIDKSKRQSADADGAIAYTYEYQPGSYDAVKTKRCYASGSFTNLVATYEYEWLNTQPGTAAWDMIHGTQRVTLTAGWNIVSCVYNGTTTFGQIIAGKGVSDVNRYNPATGANQLVSSNERPKSGEAYWIYCRAATSTLVFEGVFVQSAARIALKPGWNLIAGPSSAVKASSLVFEGTKPVGAILEWAGTQYKSVDQLTPGKGYWIYCQTSGALVYPAYQDKVVCLKKTTASCVYTYYKDNANSLESKTLTSPDSQGNIYYHYLNENWNNQGYGRADKSRRQTVSNGELSYTYTYYANAPARLQTKTAYAAANYTTPGTTYTYYNDSNNRMESKTVISPGTGASIYFSFTNENWNGLGYGKTVSWITEQEIMKALGGSVDSVKLPGGKMAITDMVIDLGGGIISPHSGTLNIDTRAATSNSAVAAIKTKGDDGIVKVMQYLNERGATAKVIYLENVPYNAGIMTNLATQSGEILIPTGEFHYTARPAGMNSITDKIAYENAAKIQAGLLAKNAKGFVAESQYIEKLYRPTGTAYVDNYQFVIKSAAPSANAGSAPSTASKALKGTGMALMVLAAGLTAYDLYTSYQKDKNQGGGCNFSASVGRSAGGWMGALSAEALASIAIASFVGAPETLGGSIVVGAIIIGAAVAGSYVMSKIGEKAAVRVCPANSQTSGTSASAATWTDNAGTIHLGTSTPPSSYTGSWTDNKGAIHLGSSSSSSGSSSSSVSSVVSAVINTVSNTVSNAVSTVSSASHSISNSVSNSVSSAVHSVSSTVSNAVSHVSSAVSNTVSHVTSTVSNVVSSVVNTVSSVARTVVTAVSNTVQSAASAVRSFFSW